jgi:hypothetical protein
VPSWRSILSNRFECTVTHPSEIMSIAIQFRQSHYRTFKAFHTQCVRAQLRAEFRRLVSYTRLLSCCSGAGAARLSKSLAEFCLSAILTQRPAGDFECK